MLGSLMCTILNLEISLFLPEKATNLEIRYVLSCFLTLLLICVPLTRSALAGLHQLRTDSQ